MPSGTPTTVRDMGTATEDVTVWVDPGSHRVIKSHMTGKSDVKLLLDVNGSMPVTSTYTVDVSPA